MNKIKHTTVTLPDPLRAAIEEQQTRVWRLHSLIECVREASEMELEDLSAAISGLQDLAAEIHLALDVETLAQRAEEITDTKARRARIESAEEEAEPPHGTTQ